MRMRVLIIFLAVLLLLPSCTSTEPPLPSATPQYNQPVVQTPTPTLAVAPLESTITADMIKEKFQITFNGLERTEESPKRGNSSLSTYGSYAAPPHPYHDDETDTLYYVSYGHDRNERGEFIQLNDYYLYALKGDINEPIIEMPVNYPNFYGDYIYFLSNESAFDLYGFNHPPIGKLYRYNKSDESIELVLDIDITEFSIVGDHLYYRTADVIYADKAWEGREPFRMSLDGGEPEPTDGFLPQFYGEYQLRYTPREMVDDVGNAIGVLELVSEKETVKLGEAFPMNDYSDNYFILNETLWFICVIDDTLQLFSIDLPTSQVNVYANPENTGSFVILNDEVFMASSPDIYRYDKSSERFVKMSSPAHFNGSPYYMRTDGRYLYIVTIIGTDGRVNYPTHLARVDILENGQYECVVVSAGANHPSFGEVRE